VPGNGATTEEGSDPRKVFAGSAAEYVIGVPQFPVAQDGVVIPYPPLKPEAMPCECPWPRPKRRTPTAPQAPVAQGAGPQAGAGFE